jgi:hypothetical protein
MNTERDREPMESTPSVITNGHFDLTQDEAYALLDREAHRRLGMSAQAFIAAWDAGQFDDDPDRPDVMYVAMLLPLVE